MRALSFVFILSVLLLMLFCAGCACDRNCDSEVGKCSLPDVDDDDLSDDDDTGGLDDDDITDDDDDDDDNDDNDDDDNDVGPPPETFDQPAYVAGGTFSGSSIAMDYWGKSYLATCKSRHLRVYSNTNGVWNYQIVDFGVFANPAIARGNSYPFHISYYDWYGGYLWYANNIGGWNPELVDNSGDVGHYSSVAIDASGYAHIAYNEEVSRNSVAIKYATNKSGTWHTEVVEAGEKVGRFPCLALDSSAHPYVIYNDDLNGELRLARNVGSGWETVDLPFATPYNRSGGLAIDNSDQLHIAYRATDTYRHVRYATGTFDALTTEEVVHPTDVGDSVTLTLDNQQNVHIAFFNNASGETVYAQQTDKGWTIEELGDVYPVQIQAKTPDNVAISFGNFGVYENYTGIWVKTRIDSGFVATECAVDADSSYRGRVAVYDDSNQAIWWAYMPDIQDELEFVYGPLGNAGGHLDMDLSQTGADHISFYNDLTQELMVAINRFSYWDVQTVDSDAAVGTYNSILVDSSDSAHIAYFDESSGNLKYANNTSGSWQTYLVDDDGIVGLYSALAKGTGQDLQVVYVDMTGGAINYASGTGQTWSIEPVVDVMGEYTDLSLDLSGAPHIVYQEDGLQYAYQKEGVWTVETIDGTALSGKTGIVSVPLELATVYQSFGSRLSYAYKKWNTSWGTFILDEVGRVGTGASIYSPDSDDTKYIAYVGESAVWYLEVW